MSDLTLGFVLGLWEWLHCGRGLWWAWPGSDRGRGLRGALAVGVAYNRHGLWWRGLAGCVVSVGVAYAVGVVCAEVSGVGEWAWFEWSVCGRGLRGPLTVGVVSVGVAW